MGKYADLVVVRGNPLDDIEVTRRVEWVVRAGEVFDPVALLESVEGELGPDGPVDDAWWKGDVRLGR